MSQTIKEFKAEKQAQVSMAEAVTRLRKNRDFKKVIAEGFFKDEAVRCTAIKAEFAMKSEESQRLINNRITSIGELNVFLKTLEAIGNLAVRDLAKAEEEIDGRDESELLIEETAEE